mgnify:CR=1 FL=1
MDVTCSRCGGTFPQSEVDGRFQGTCPKCLAKALLEESSAGGTASSSEAPLEPGRTIGGYEVVEQIGAGGMGVVYKARQPHLDRFVALKVLPRHLAEQPDFEERFRREAKALASLSHANIVGVHDYGIADGISYLVMEYVDGVNLRSILREKRLMPEEAIRIVPQLCDALEYAHGEGIVHRDIKPENILIDKRGRVKVADFGLAKILGGEGAQGRSITRTEAVMGTPSYMAPEQLEDAKRVDHRADIYSMGVVFYEMLTGELPLGSFAPPSQKVHVDVRLDEVVLKTLAKEPERRYQHASEVKEDVTQMTRLAPRGDRAPAPPTSRRRSLVRRLVWLLVLAGLALGGVYGYRALRPGVADLPAAPPWFERIVMSDDDLPGLYEFESPGRSFAAGPLRATTPADVNLVLESLQKAGVGWKAVPPFRQACLVMMKPLKMGYAALLTDSDGHAREFLAEVTLPSGLESWTHRDGATVVVAYGTADSPQARAAWEQMIDWLCARIALPLPYTLPAASSARLAEDDLPMGCSITREWSWPGNPPPADGWPYYGVPPQSVSGACIQWIGPGEVQVHGLDIVRASVRRAFFEQVSRAREVLCLGSLISYVSSRHEAEGDAISQQILVKLGLARAHGEEMADRLASAAALAPEMALAVVAVTDTPRTEPLDDHSLTALVLSRLVDADLEWNPGAGPSTLLAELRRSPIREGLSVLAPPFLRSVTEDSAEVDVPGCVRFRVNFGEQDAEVEEFRFPQSGRRVIRTSGGWSSRPPTSTGDDMLIASGDSLRETISACARAGGANFVTSPEVRGVVRGESRGRWPEALGVALRGHAQAAWYEADGILRFGERKRMARMKATPWTRVLPSDPSAPRVSVDVWETDFRRTALRIAEAGKVSVEFAPEVKGKVTARLVDVPWADALEALAGTCGYALSLAAGGGLRLTEAPGAQHTPLEPLLFSSADLPSGWEVYNFETFGGSVSWGVSDHEIDYLLTRMIRLDGISSRQVSEAYEVAWIQGRTLQAQFLLLSFRDLPAGEQLEARLATTRARPGQGGKEVVLRNGPLLAIGNATYGDDSEFDALVSKLRERMGLEGK